MLIYNPKISVSPITTHLPIKYVAYAITAGERHSFIDKEGNLYFENSEGGHGGGANLNQLAVTDAMQIGYFLQQLVDN